MLIVDSLSGSVEVWFVMGRLMRRALDVFESKRINFVFDTWYAVTREVLPKPLLLRDVGDNLSVIMS